MGTQSILSGDDKKAAVRALNGLIEACRDAQLGFERAAKDVSEPMYAEWFGRTALQRAQFTDELQRMVRALGAFAEDEGTLVGAVHRGYLDAKAVLEDGSVLGILKECERGELRARRAYEDALRSPLPLEARDKVQMQFAMVRDSLERIREQMAAMRKRTSH